MKNFFILTVTAMFLFSGLSFAEETETECPYMRESDSRENPKSDSLDKPSSESSENTVIRG